MSQSSFLSRFSWGKIPFVQENDTPCVFVVRVKLAEQGFTPATFKTILSSIKMQYNFYLEKWLVYCNERALNIFSPSVSEALEFLSVLYQNGPSYRTARSALSPVF